MPASRTFNYEYLKTLARDHPDWSLREYADAVTEEVRTRLKDPKCPRIKPNAIAAVFHRHRDTWLEQGVSVPPRKGNGRVIPWVGIDEPYRMTTELKHMRVLARLDLGEQVEPRKARLAEKFARNLREHRRVVDLKPNGRSTVRPARPDEVDGTGELLSLYARNPGLTDAEWERMTPDERRQAGDRWRPPEERDTPGHLG